MKEKLHISLPVIVEGRYDKARLQSVADAHIITTDGFGIFRETEKKQLIRRLAQNGIIVLTDSDGAGLLIRSYLKRILPEGSVHNLYVPPIPGKERRKASPSKEGLLGVEGIDCDILYSLLLPYSDGNYDIGRINGDELTKSRFYSDGFSGGKDSSDKRLKLAEYLSLPRNLSANALIEAINMLGLQEKYREFLSCADEQSKAGS